ncbi:MAG: peptidoglycan-associated lipoprotein Pal [Candidatus Korobacteraceae bacterium]
MKLTRSQWIRIIIALAVVLAVGACGKKKVASAPPPPPPPPPAPTASLTANPNTIQAGQASTLTWRTDYATDVTIDQLGKVDPSGSRAVTPAESTTYHLVAKNDSGTQEATARITVVSSPPPPPPQTSSGTDEQLFSENMKDVFYDYDSYDISAQYQQVLQADTRFLKQHPNMKFTIEGHCDERGSTEYNLALGDNRANAAKQVLAQLGISADHMRTISYGKEKPFCTESNESCWQQNRRAHFVYQK